MQVYRLLEYPSVAQLTTFVTTKLDKLLSANRPVPLSRGQHLALSSGLDHSFLLIRLNDLLPGVMLSPRILASAWASLVKGYGVLRTIITPPVSTEDSAEVKGPFKQRVLPVAEVSAGDLLCPLPSTGLAQDLSSLQSIMEAAMVDMATLPPVRLLLSSGDASPVAYLSASRLLLDHWAMQVLANDMAVLYRAASENGTSTNGSKPHRPLRSSFLHEMERLSSSDPSSDAEERTLALLHPGDIKPPQQPSSLLKSSSPDSTLDLPPRLCSALNTYCVKRQVAPWSVLLSAYVQALAERTKPQDQWVSVLVDIDQPASHTDALGPVSIPFPLTLSRAEAGSTNLLDVVKKQAEASLVNMHLPASQGLGDKGPCLIGSGVPGFTYRDSSSGVQTLGPSIKTSQAMSLTATASRLGPGKQSTYVLQCHAGQGQRGFVDLLQATLEKVRTQDVRYTYVRRGEGGDRKGVYSDIRGVWVIGYVYGCAGWVL
jgi:hypothetical protein